MSFQDVWNTTYEGIPADAENINLGANRIRDLKVNIRERANVDHSWGDSLDNGRHNQVGFNQATADPAGGNPAISYAYSKIASNSGRMELFYEDNTGLVTQLTLAGSLDTPPAFPSGTRLIFPQATPPAGWTFIPGWGDRVIRMVDDGSGGAAGGAWNITGLGTSTSLGSMFASSSSSGTGSGTATGSVDPHVLSQAELPPHSHNVTVNVSSASNGGPSSGGTNVEYGSSTFSTDNGPGQNAGHSHTFTGSVSVALSISTSTSLGGAPAVSVAGDGTWRPAYGNACLGQKN